MPVEGSIAYHRIGAGPPLVLIHGVGHDHTAWNPVQEHLAAHRDVIAVDLPGHGSSPSLPAGSAHTVDAYAHAVRSLITELDVDRPHVAGNSLGAAIALELARGGHARSAVALAPIGFWTPLEVSFAVASLRVSRMLGRLALPFAPRLVHSAVLRTVLLAQFYAHPARLVPADALAAVNAFTQSTGLPHTLPQAGRYRFRLDPEIPVPVTIAWGARDRLLLPRQARRARLALPSARHVWLPDSGHVPMSDQPDEVAALLLAAPEPGVTPGSR